MPKIIKHNAWAYYDGPVTIITLRDDKVDYLFFVDAKFYGQQISRGGFTSQKDAFGYGLQFVLEQIEMLRDRLSVMLQTEIGND